MLKDFGTLAFGTGITWAFAAAAVATIPAGFAVAGLAVAGIGAMSLLGGTYAGLKAEDPIDKNFKSLARPRPPKPFFVKAKPGTPIDADLANAINAVLENQAHAIGLDRAIITSVNRAQGAAVAKERTFEKLQMKNARKYASELAIVLRGSAGLRSKAANKLRNKGAVFSITEDQAYNIGEILLEKGVQSKVKKILARYCMNTRESNEVLLRFVAQLSNVHQFEVTFPDFLSKPKLASAEKEIASSLEDFSKSTYISV